MIQATSICDSINPQGSRLITMLFKYPKFLHQETLRHRTLYIHDCLYDPDFSFSVSSARAIPFSKLIEEVESDTLSAAPLFWGAEQRGMAPGGELTGDALEVAKLWWKRARLDAAKNARAMAKAQGILEAMPWEIPHKSIVNRIIEPYFHVNCLVTGTDRGWNNWHGLRLDKAADPTLQILAQEAWKVWNESKPRLLQPGEWHLPYIQLSDMMLISGKEGSYKYNLNTIEDRDLLIIKISAARCARLSYLSFSTQKRSTISEDLELYNKLVGSDPIHASPLEHQATPDEWEYSCIGIDNGKWLHPEQSGNLDLGWRQYRKLLPNESIAPLPLEYKESI